MILNPATPRLDPWKTLPATIRRVWPESPEVDTYDLEIQGTSATAPFRFKPGQFNMLYVPGVGEAAISIAGHSIDNGYARHSIRNVGRVTAAIHAAGEGMQLGVRGPFGTSWPMQTLENRDLVIVAGGVGLAPLRSLIEHVVAHRGEFGKVSLIVGARTPDDLIYKLALEEWKQHAIELKLTVDRSSKDWQGHVGVVTLLLERLRIADPTSTHVMTCGPEVMMRYVAKSAIERDIPEQNIFVTLERNMNCAIGLCGHCQLGPKFLCKDGPVFCYTQVRDLLRVQDL